MRGAKPVIVAGTALIIFGIIFHLQGQAILGPESSFMYSNPDWINYGFQISAAGAIIISIGIFLRFRKTNS